jgi:uncharacterized repeat protein (TIGR01451 family)
MRRPAAGVLALALAGLAGLAPTVARGQAAACSATEVLETFSFSAWTAGSRGPTTFTSGSTQITFQSEASPPAAAYQNNPSAQPTPALEQSGGINNSLVHRHTVAGTNAHLSNFTVTFNQSVNKLRYTAVDVDYQNGSWQDRIVTTATVNGVANTNPTSVTPVTPARYTIALPTITATTSTNCAAGDNTCNVVVNHNANLITFATMEFRSGPSHSGAGQGAGWNTFQWCAPRPALTKAFSPAAIVAGGTSTLTFTITSATGATARTGLTFTDTLPAGLAIASPNGYATTCGGTPTVTATPGSNTFTVGGTGVNAAAGASTCTVSVNVTSATAGNRVNGAAQITAIAGMTNSVTNQTLSVYSPPTATKSFGTTNIAAGATTTLTLAVANPAGNPGAIGTVQLPDTFPAGMTLANTTFTFTPAACGTVTNTSGGASAAGDGNARLNVATLAAGASCQVAMNVTSSTGGAAVNTTSAVTAASPVALTGGTASATLNVYAPPTLAKSFVPASIASGGTSALRLVLTNPATNPGAISTVAVTDPLGTFNLGVAAPAAVTFTPAACGTVQSRAAVGSGTYGALTAGHLEVQFSAASLAAGSSCQADIDVTSTTIGARNNTTAAPTAAGPVALTGTAASATLTVLAAPTVAKSFGVASLASGGNTSLTVTIGNTNAVPVTLTSPFTDTFPAGMTIGTAGNTGTCPGVTATAGAGSFTVANGTSIPAGGCTVIVNVTSSTAGAAVNTIAAGSLQTTGGPNAAPASATLDVYTSPTVAKSFGAASIPAGGTTTLTLAVTNPAANPGPLGTVVLPDTFPAGLTLADATFAFTPAVCGTVTKVGGAASAAGDGNAQLNVATLAAGTSCQVVLNVTSSTAGSITNTTTAVTAASPVALTGGTANASLTVLGAPTVTKSFGSGSLAVGGTTTLTITVQNPNAVALTGVAFTDNYPAPITNSGTPGAAIGGAGCTGTLGAAAGGTSLALTGGTVPASTTCTYAVQVQGAAAGSGTNSTGTVTSANGATGAAATAAIAVYAPPTVAKSFGAASIPAGGTTTLTLAVTNPAANPGPLGTVALPDTFPAGLTLADATFAFTPAVCGTVTKVGGGVSLAGDGNAQLNVATLAAGASCQVTVNVTSTTPGSITNTTTAVTAASPVALTGGTANASLTVLAAPTVAKSFGVASLASGGNTSLTVTIGNTNATPVTLTSLFTDTFPAGMTIGIAGNTGTCPGVTATAGAGSFTIANGTSIPAGGCTVIVNVTSSTAGAAVNVIAAGSLQTTAGSNAAPASATLNVYTPPTVTKSFSPTTIGPGGSSTLTIAVTNPAGNPGALTGVSVDDTYTGTLANNAAGSVSCTAGGSATLTGGTNGGTSVGFTAGTIPAGGTCTITQGVTATSTSTNSTTAPFATGPVALTGTATTGVVLTVSQATLTKSFGAAAITDGATTTLVFTLTNGAGNPAQSGIGFVDTLPSGLAMDSTAPLLAYSAGCSGPATASYATGSRQLTLAGLAMANGTASCTVTVSGLTNASSQVNPACPAASFTNGSAAIGSLARVTNGVTDQCLVVNRVNPSLTKAFSPATIDQGAVSTLVFTIANSGTNPAQTGIAFTDTLPASVLVASPPAIATTCPSGVGAVSALAGGGAITVGGATLNAGQSSCTISVNVTSGTPGVYSNTDAANLSATSNITTTGVNASLTVLPLPSLTKAFSPSTVGTGQNSVLTFTISNLAGGPARSGLAFTDTLPAGLEIGTPAGVVNTCGGSPTVTATPGNGVFAIGGPGVNAAAGPSTCTISVNVTGNTPGTYTNGNAQVTAVTGLLNAVTDQALTVLARPTVAKAFGAASIAPGGVTTLTVTLSNANAVPLTGAAFTDVFPVTPGPMTLANVTVSNTCGGTLTDNGGGALNAGDAGIQLAGGTIPASGSCAVTVNVTATTPGTHTNTLAAGSVTTANAASNTAPASASLLVTAPPTIAKAFSPATIAADGTSTITFTLANPNGIALTAGAFTDTLAGMAIAANGNAGGTCAGAGGNALTAGQTALSFAGLTIPASGSCTVTVVVASDIPGVHSNQASGVATAEAATGAASNVATLTVNAAAPTIAKAFSPATIAADGTSTITFTIANTNGVALTSAGLTDNLANMAVAADGAAGGTCTGAASNTFTAGQANLTLSNLTIPANGSCTVTVVVRSDVPGTHANTASGVSSAQAPTGAVSNTATLTVNAAAPTIAKAFAPATIAAGATSTITFTLANTLGIPLTAGAFSDNLVNMAIAATGAAGGTCAGAAANSFTAGQAALSFTGLTVPANGSCTVTVVVTSNVPGTHNNTTSVLDTAEAPDSAVSNTATLTVTAVAPSIAKAFSPASITADGTSTVTLTMSNPLGIPLTAASFSDTLAGMVVAASGAAGGTCAGAGGNFLTAGQGNVVITGLTIPAAVGVTPGSCTVTFVVTGDVPGTYPNQATGVASTEAPTGAPSNSASLAITAATPAISKAFSPAGIPVLSTSTITFTLANTNGIALTGASFTDTLANMTVNATGPAGGTCAGAASNSFTAGATGLLNFSGLTVPANGTCTVTLVVTSSVIGTHPNSASGVSSNEAATGAVSNTASLTVQPLPPTIAKAFSPAGILSGGTTTLTVTIGNPNPSAITITSVTDNLPAGVVVAAAPAASTTCAGGSLDDGTGALNGGDTAIRLTGGNLGANSSCTFQVNVTAPTFGVYVNTIPTGALTTSGGFNTSAASATLTVDPVADLAVIKSAPASVGAGQVLNYTVSVVNNGPDPANLAQFADTVPAPITGISAVCGAATGGAVCGTVNVAGNAVTSTITTLPAGASVTFTISGTATGLGASTNTATITAPAGVFDPVAANNSSSATTTVLAPDLTITKTHAGSFTVGVNGAYTITVSNGLGSLATSGTVTVVDTLPAGLAYVSGSGTGWSCAAAGQVVTCTTSNPIAAGTSAPAISLVVAVSATAMPSVLNTVVVSGGGEPAAAANNNTATDNTIVVAAAVNAFAPDGERTGMPGTAVFYPHTFNAGLAGSVAFATTSVPMPAVPGWSQTIYRDTNCNGTLDGAEGAAPLAGAVAVNPGDAVCLIVRDSIPGAAPYNAQNAITVTATFNGSQTYARTDLTTVGAAAGAGLTLAKTVRNVTQGGTAATTGTARPDDILEYAITFTNTGAGPVSAIVVTDATPAFTLFQSAACPVAPLPANLTACSVTTQPAVNGTGSVVWTFTGSLLSAGSGSVTYQVRVSN